MAAGDPKPKGKSSALKRLKAGLVTAGLIGPQSRASMSKKQRAKAAASGKKRASPKDSVLNNPYELQITRQKRSVIGEKKKGVVGRPGVSRQAGEEKRRKTLLEELGRRNKAGGIVDRRFGENDPTMSLEDKMLQRFTRERQNRSKGNSMFNLADSDEDDLGMGMTHMGRSLADMEEFDDIGLGQDEEDGSNGAIDKKTVSHSHFGGFEPAEPTDPDKPKSKAEVMRELIAKSKAHKAERMKEKEEDEELRMSLDAGLDDIRGLLSMASVPFGRKPLPSQSSLFTRNQDEKEAEAKEKGEDGEIVDPRAGHDYPDEYDQQVKLLAGERRARPSDRTKSEVELALEEKERLERAERHRKRRMQGLSSDTEDESTGGGSAQRKRRREGPGGGDDLEDDFTPDQAGEEDLMGQGLMESDDDESEEEEGDSDEEEEEEEVTESEDNDDLTDTEEVMEQFDEEPAGSMDQVEESKVPVSHSKDLPYTFPAPSTHEEYRKIVKGLGAKDQATVTKRLRALYHPSLGPENKARMERLCTILYEHTAYLASCRPAQVDVIAALFPHLHALTTTYPEVAAKTAVEEISMYHARLSKVLGAPSSSVSAFPGAREILYLQTLMRAFPASDFRHPVITPVHLLIGRYLGQGKPANARDALSGLSLCSLYAEGQGPESRRWMPEALSFLQDLLLAMLPAWSSVCEKASSLSSPDLPGTFPIPSLSSALRLQTEDAKEIHGDLTAPLGLAQSFQRLSQNQGAATEEIKWRILASSLRLLSRYADIHTGLPAFDEAFSGAITLLQGPEGEVPALPESIQGLVTQVTEKLVRMREFARQRRTPLMLQAHKPIAIASHVPRFDEGFSSTGKVHDPDRERAEAQKLRAAYRKERKGALRELRRDNQFLAAERAKEQKERDEAYKRRIKNIEGILAEDQHEMKQEAKEKEKKRRR